jgi:hypothetical protein
VVARERAGGLDIEAGPLSAPPHVALVEPPAGMPLVTHALVEPSPAGAADEHFLRARITVRSAVAGDVRVEGGRVYIDLSSAQPARAAASAAQPARPASAAASRQRDSVGPVIARLREMEPFVRSAANEPAPDVLRALHQTLTGVEASLRATPPGSGDAHATLLSAVAMARSAVAPDFTGDRVTQARGAFTLVDAVALEPEP